MRDRTLLRRAAHRSGVAFVRDPGSRHPFSRITKLVKAVNTAALAQDHPATVTAQAELAAYRSRGHGHRPTMCRRIGGAWSTDRSRYMPADEDRKHARGRA